MIEPAILADLWQTHSPKLLLIARAVGEPAEDAVQEAFASLATQQKLPQDPLAWLVLAARNWLISCNRRRRTQANYLADNKKNGTWFANTSHQIEARLDSQQVTQWLQALPEDERQVIAMHLWGAMTFRQIAETMNCSPATANRLYHSGLATLKARANITDEVCHER